jgi:ribonuclease Z
VKLTFLGTGAACPTTARSVSAVAIEIGSSTLLLDCGEGTLRQIARYGVNPNICAVFISHTHGDHILGLPGLIHGLALAGRTAELTLFAPSSSGPLMAEVVRAGTGCDGLPFSVAIRAVRSGVPLAAGGVIVSPIAVQHRGLAFGYALRSCGALLVYSGDTRPCSEITRAARGADLLIHEATFGAGEDARAKETGHSTAAEAGSVAREAGARRLVLTHISARYLSGAPDLLRQARSIFSETAVAHDGMTVRLGGAPG